MPPTPEVPEPPPPPPPPGPNNPPTAVADALSIPLNSPLRFDPLANDEDIDGDGLTVISVTDGSKGTATLHGDGTITYEPTPGNSGSDTFTYEVEDARGEVTTGTVTVFIAQSASTYNMCGTLRESSELAGTLYDEGGPSANYGTYQNCAFLIDPGFDGTIDLSFTSFSIENGWDRFYIYEGRGDTGILIANLTGSPGLPLNYSISNSAYFVFTSDHGGSGPGFEMSWSVTPTSGNLTATTNRYNIYRTNETVLGEVANFTSPSNLSYSIVSGGGYFNALGSQDLFSFMTPSLPGDAVLRVSDSSNGHTYDLNIKVVKTFKTCSDFSSTDLAGVIVDSGGDTANYSNNQNCGFLIQPPSGTSVTLEIPYFNVERGYDKLFIYDGVDDTAPQLGSAVTGKSRGTFTSTGPSMYVKWTSDFGATWPGYRLRWVTND
ncbi:MAG: cadherin-like domain-containing protein [Pseudobdellovibrionaceae bacterium]|nr:MAG: cadherin-like domain-containing protein [Pseudobdellovibrionaceae bacterium]